MRNLTVALLLTMAACTPATETPPAADAPVTTSETGDAATDTTAATANDIANATTSDAAMATDLAGNAATSDTASAHLRGRVSYPSEELPAMRVCALDRDDPGRAFCTITAVNQPHYELAVPAGAWWLLAWPRDAGTAGDPGLLSAASECLGSGGTQCDDHALRVIEVTAGAAHEGLDINDWYYDPAQFPPPMPPAGDQAGEAVR